MLDPKYKGYDPLDDEQTVSVEEIFAKNREHFPESTSVAKHFLSSYIADRQLLFYSINENRDNLKKGSLFTLATVLLDWYICS